MWWGTFDFDSHFDWGHDYNRPKTALKDLVIYEMSVRCFTASKSSGLDANRRGTYLGVADKVGFIQSSAVAQHSRCRRYKQGLQTVCDVHCLHNAMAVADMLL